MKKYKMHPEPLNLSLQRNPNKFNNVKPPPQKKLVLGKIVHSVKLKVVKTEQPKSPEIVELDTDEVFDCVKQEIASS